MKRLHVFAFFLGSLLIANLGRSENSEIPLWQAVIQSPDTVVLRGNVEPDNKKSPVVRVVLEARDGTEIKRILRTYVQGTIEIEKILHVSDSAIGIMRQLAPLEGKTMTVYFKGHETSPGNIARVGPGSKTGVFVFSLREVIASSNFVYQSEIPKADLPKR